MLWLLNKKTRNARLLSNSLLSVMENEKDYIKKHEFFIGMIVERVIDSYYIATYQPHLADNEIELLASTYKCIKNRLEILASKSSEDSHLQEASDNIFNAVSDIMMRDSVIRLSLHGFNDEKKFEILEFTIYSLMVRALAIIGKEKG